MSQSIDHVAELQELAISPEVRRIRLDAQMIAARIDEWEPAPFEAVDHLPPFGISRPTCCDARDYHHDGRVGQCGRALQAMCDHMSERAEREARERGRVA